MEAMEKLIGFITGILIVIWVCWKLFTAFLPYLILAAVLLIAIKAGTWMYRISRGDEDHPNIDATAETYNE